MALVSVYGTLRQGQGNYERLLSQYGDPLSTERTEEEFTMESLGGFPALIPGNSSAVIELYDVDEDTMRRLDMLEGYPTFYDRKLISTSLGDAWIYFMEESHGSWERPIIESGDWVEYTVGKVGGDGAW